MSDLNDNISQNQNTVPDPDSVDPDSSDKDSVSSTAEDQNVSLLSAPAAAKEVDPLPDFNSSTPADEISQPPVKTSTATPANLSDLFTPQPEEEPSEVETPAPDPVYRISPAEADLSNNYPLPTLDEESAAEEQEGESSSGWKTTWAIVREVGETIILTLIIFFVIQLFVRNFRVVGTSMVGNLHDGQYLIIDKVSYNPYVRENIGLGGPNRGDVIVFKPPRNPDDDYVKRVIGLPGEKVQVIKGQVFVNDELLEETFQPTPGSYSMSSPVTVPEGQVFVLGDNRNNSNDSHNWGPLPMENIVGRAWVSYWPPDQWGIIPNDMPTEEATLWHLVGQVIPAANAQNE